MILIGQFDSPFVRRVGIALHLYGIGYDHRPWSTFGDAERVRDYTPLGRVPALVLADGTVLVDSATILDHLDEQAGAAALVARAGPARLHTLRRAALATGLCDKTVSLIYERVLHDHASQAWIDRCTGQQAGVLQALAAERAGCATAFFGGDRPDHADIALGCAVTFIGQVQPGLLAPHPVLQAHAARCEALDCFGAVRQDFIPPA